MLNYQSSLCPFFSLPYGEVGKTLIVVFNGSFDDVSVDVVYLSVILWHFRLSTFYVRFFLSFSTYSFILSWNS